MVVSHDCISLNKQGSRLIRFHSLCCSIVHTIVLWIFQQQEYWRQRQRKCMWYMCSSVDITVFVEGSYIHRLQRILSLSYMEHVKIPGLLCLVHINWLLTELTRVCCHCCYRLLLLLSCASLIDVHISTWLATSVCKVFLLTLFQFKCISNF